MFDISYYRGIYHGYLGGGVGFGGLGVMSQRSYWDEKAFDKDGELEREAILCRESVLWKCLENEGTVCILYTEYSSG